MSDHAASAHRQGIALHERGDYAGALAAYDAALAMSPEAAGLHFSRGNALVMLNQPEQAVAAYDACLLRDPGHASAHYNRALALVRLQRWGEALSGLDQALARNPAAEVWNNRSGVLQQMGRYQEALDSIQQVLRLSPNNADAFYNAGILLLTLNRFEEAAEALERALALNPHHSDALGFLATAVLQSCDWHRLSQLTPQLLAAIRDGRSVVPPVSLLAISDDPMLQRRCAELNLRRSLADTDLAREQPSPLWSGTAYIHERIRVGYLSSDFRNHPVGTGIAGLLERHDRRAFEIIGLSTGRNDGSAARQRIVQACDQFHDLAAMGSAEAARLIRALEVDILIDLNGQTQGWRPAILKYRAAPVQAAYFGFAGTTGADFIDYIIGDPWVTPFALQTAISEKIVQLPRGFWPVDTALPEPEPVTRAEMGLPDDSFVFCCFNAHHKIGPRLFDSWMRILKSVPGSILWLRDGSAATNARLRREAGLRGVSEPRIYFAERVDRFARHLGRHAVADLFLDTFPYNAHATAVDALWAGLPILTLQGQSFVSRVAAGFLSKLALPGLITTNSADYEAAAVALSKEPEHLADLRRRLKAGRSALFDSNVFVQSMETALRMMRDRTGAAPQSFAVPDRRD